MTPSASVDSTDSRISTMYVTSESGLSQTSCVSGIWRRSLQNSKVHPSNPRSANTDRPAREASYVERSNEEDDGPGIEEVDR